MCRRKVRRRVGQAMGGLTGPRRCGGRTGKGFFMHPFSTTDLSEADGTEDVGEGHGTSPPDRFHRRKPAQRIRKRARRSRTNDMAKRGMHQRRNKRVAW
jgi:hypothetical protein